jgi:hypothetical protein
MRKTLIWLSGVPYGLTVTQPMKKPGVNMFLEKVNNNRTCASIGIAPWFCSCLELVEIDRAVIDNTSNSTYQALDQTT